jgi:hypothetical protein
VNQNLSAVIPIFDLAQVYKLSKNNTFATLLKPSEYETWLPIYKTEVIEEESTSKYKKFTLSLQYFSNGNYKSSNFY